MGGGKNETVVEKRTAAKEGCLSLRTIGVEKSNMEWIVGCGGWTPNDAALKIRLCETIRFDVCSTNWLDD